jgi:hypothetical protein
VQLFFARCEAAEPNLRALKVRQYTYRPTRSLRRLPDGAQVLLVIGIVAVTHVESGNIHSSRNQLRQAFRS